MSSPPRRLKINRDSSTRRSSPSQVSELQPQNTVAHLSRPSRKDCRYCNKDHPLRKCFRFRRLSIPERIKVVRKLGYCFNCLAHSHRLRNCRSRERCGICLEEHHTLLHRETQAVRRNTKKPFSHPHKQRNGRHRPHDRSQSNNLRVSKPPASSSGSPTIVINVTANP